MRIRAKASAAEGPCAHAPDRGAWHESHGTAGRIQAVRRVQRMENGAENAPLQRRKARRTEDFLQRMAVDPVICGLVSIPFPVLQESTGNSTGSNLSQRSDVRGKSRCGVA